MSGTVKHFTYEELIKIWKINNYEENYILKPNLPYSKGCIILDRKTGKTIREFDKNYDLFKALMEGYIPGQPWKIKGLFGEETTQSTGLRADIAVDMCIDYVKALLLMLPTMIGEELPKDWESKLYEKRKKLRG